MKEWEQKKKQGKKMKKWGKNKNKIKEWNKIREGKIPVKLRGSDPLCSRVSLHECRLQWQSVRGYLSIKLSQYEKPIQASLRIYTFMYVGIIHS